MTAGRSKVFSRSRVSAEMARGCLSGPWSQWGAESEQVLGPHVGAWLVFTEPCKVSIKQCSHAYWTLPLSEGFFFRVNPTLSFPCLHYYKQGMVCRSVILAIWKAKAGGSQFQALLEQLSALANFCLKIKKKGLGYS